MFEVYGFTADGADHFVRYSNEGVLSDLVSFYSLLAVDVPDVDMQLSNLKLESWLTLNLESGATVKIKRVSNHLVLF